MSKLFLAMLLLLASMGNLRAYVPTQPSSVAPVYSPLNYGAVCNGSHHSISATLGVTTKAGLAAYSASANGPTPYSWITNTLWSSPEVALPMTVAAVTNATTLYFDSTLQIPVGAVVSGTQITGSPTVTAVSNPSTVTQVTNGTTSTIGTKSITVNSGTATPVGSHPTPQTGLSIDDYVVSSNATNVTLKYGITASSIATATTLTFQPPSSVTISGSGLTANKPSVQSAASTATVNYWVYFTWTLSDAMVAAAEVDWLGTQAAIEAATANNSNGGGAVQLPTGNCIMDNATVSGNGTGSLVIHESPLNASLLATAGVSLIGNGSSANSYLSWPSEMGAGRSALSFGVPYATFDNALGRYGNGNMYYGALGHVTVAGPGGAGAPTVGTIATRTSGILVGSRRELDDVVAQGFYIGATYENVDHTRWSNVFLNSNSMGLRVGPAGVYLNGDNVIDHLELTGNSLANLSLDKSGFWAADNINKFYCAYSPKCIRLEPGLVDSYSQPTGLNMGDSTFNGINAEDLGGCFICDDNYGPNSTVGASIAGGELLLVQMEFLHLGMSYNAAKQPAGSPFNYWLMIPETYNSRFQFFNFNPPAVSGMAGVAYMDSTGYGTGGDEFDGSFTSILSTLGSTPFFVFYGVPYGNGQYNIKMIEPNAWVGHPEIYSSGTSGAQGTPLEYTATGGYGYLEVQPAGGTNPFGGINMTTSTTAGGTTIVATRLCYSTDAAVGIPGSGTITAGHLAALATGGTVTNGTNNTGVIIGTIVKVTGSTAFVNVGPNGSCD